MQCGSWVSSYVRLLLYVCRAGSQERKMHVTLGIQDKRESARRARTHETALEPLLTSHFLFPFIAGEAGSLHHRANMHLAQLCETLRGEIQGALGELPAGCRLTGRASR